MGEQFKKTVAWKALMEAVKAGRWDAASALMEEPSGADAFWREDVAGNSAAGRALERVWAGKDFLPESAAEAARSSPKAAARGFADLADKAASAAGKAVYADAGLAACLKLLPKDRRVECESALESMKSAFASAAEASGTSLGSAAGEVLLARLASGSLDPQWRLSPEFWGLCRPGAGEAQKASFELALAKAAAAAGRAAAPAALRGGCVEAAMATAKEASPEEALAALLAAASHEDFREFEALGEEEPKWAVDAWRKLRGEEAQASEALAGLAGEGLGLDKAATSWALRSWRDGDGEGRLFEIWVRKASKLLASEACAKEAEIVKEAHPALFRAGMEEAGAPAPKGFEIDPEADSAEWFEALRLAVLGGGADAPVAARTVCAALAERVLAEQAEDEKAALESGAPALSRRVRAGTRSRGLRDACELLWCSGSSEALAAGLGAVVEVGGIGFAAETTGFPRRILSHDARHPAQASHVEVLLSKMPLDSKWPGERSERDRWIWSSSSSDELAKLQEGCATSAMMKAVLAGGAESPEGKAAFAEWDEALAGMWKSIGAWRSETGPASDGFGRMAPKGPECPPWPAQDFKLAFAAAWDAFVEVDPKLAAETIVAKALAKKSRGEEGLGIWQAKKTLEMVSGRSREALAPFLGGALEAECASCRPGEPKASLIEFARAASEYPEISMEASSELACARLAAAGAAGLGKGMIAGALSNAMEGDEARGWRNFLGELVRVLPAAGQELLWAAQANPEGGDAKAFGALWRAAAALGSAGESLGADRTRQGEWLEGWEELEFGEAAPASKEMSASLDGLFCAVSGFRSGEERFERVKALADKWKVVPNGRMPGEASALERCVDVLLGGKSDWGWKGKRGESGGKLHEALLKMGFDPSDPEAPGGRDALSLAAGLERGEAPTATVKAFLANKKVAPGRGELLATLGTGCSLSEKMVEALEAKALETLEESGLSKLAGVPGFGSDRLIKAAIASERGKAICAEDSEGMSLAGRLADAGFDLDRVARASSCMKAAGIEAGKADKAAYARRLCAVADGDSHWKIAQDLKWAALDAEVAGTAVAPPKAIAKDLAEAGWAREKLSPAEAFAALAWSAVENGSVEALSGRLQAWTACWRLVEGSEAAPAAAAAIEATAERVRTQGPSWADAPAEEESARLWENALSKMGGPARTEFEEAVLAAAVCAAPSAPSRSRPSL